MNRPRISLRLWAVLTVLINLIIMAAFYGYSSHSADSMAQLQRQFIEDEGLNLGRSLSSGVLNDLLTGDLDHIEARLVETVQIGHVTELTIIDGERRIMSRAIRTAQGARADFDSIGAVLPALTQSHAEPVTVSTELPINADHALGSVRVTSSLQDLATLQARIFTDARQAAVLTMFFATLAIIIVVRITGAQLAKSIHFATSLVARPGRVYTGRSHIYEVQKFIHAIDEISLALKEQDDARTLSDARRAAVLDTSLDGLLIFDSNGRVVESNPAAQLKFGCSPEEMADRHADDFVTQGSRAAWNDAIRPANEGTATWSSQRRMEFRMKRQDGTSFPAEVSISSFEVEGERMVVLAVRNITDQKALEKERKRINAALQQAVIKLTNQQYALDEHAMVCISDLQGRIVYANEKLRDVSGYDPDEIGTQTVRDHLTENYSRDLHNAIRETVLSGRAWHGEIVGRKKNGEEYWTAATIAPLFNESQKPNQMISIMTDISHQKRTEQQLDAYQRHLEQLIDQYRRSEIALAEARERETALGLQVQKSMLFGKPPPRIGALDLTAHTEPSLGIDGDFYDFFRRGDECIDITIGDVMGKGMSAALFGAGIKHELYRVFAELPYLPGEEDHLGTPARIINRLHERVAPTLMRFDTFATLAFARVDLKRHHLTLVDAGHTKAIVAGEDGLRLLSSENLPLGVLAGETYTEQTIDLQNGEVVFLYSDGFTEAKNEAGEEFGLERLCSVVLGLRQCAVPIPVMVQMIRQNVQEFSASPHPADDQTCIAIHFDDERAKSRMRSFNLPWRLDRLDRLRRKLARLAETTDIEAPVRDALVLAAFEAATNIIRHAPVTLPDASLYCEVEDTDDEIRLSLYYLGPPYQPDPDPQPDFDGHSDGGFGLYIIQNSVDEVIYDTPAPGVNRVLLRKLKRVVVDV